ncbi:MAG TPA: amidohydrolase family protein [Burkholderiaceae bacterium]|nr:amidohydrolase family protein [Burkholderiaceae bacterium]
MSPDTHDLVIRGATLVDGTGAPARVADVAVDGDRIVAVNRRGAAELPGFERLAPGAVDADDGPVGRGRREIDARGLLMTPGFVDIHTHYDGQATWDAELAPSSIHGVTTAVFGNCGVGFAPLRPGTQDFLINLMEGVEDIPGTVLAEGIPFGWESFPEYLDALARLPHAIDIGAQVPHAPLRCYVMGERGGDHRERPTAAELDRMSTLLEEALRAGALGLTTSRTVKHRARDGRPTPSLSAGEDELFALAAAMRRAGRGVLEVNSDLDDRDVDVLVEAARIAGRPLSLLLIQVDRKPMLWRETLDAIHAARADGLEVNGQVGARAIGVLISLEGTLNPFGTHPAWAPLAALSPAERVARLRADPALRARLVDERPGDRTTRMIGGMLERAFEMGEVPDYEPEAARSVGAIARAQGRSPWAVALEILMADEGRGVLLHPFENYTFGDLEVVRTMLEDPATVMGVGDGGAHVGTICDGAGPTFLLTHWARDRRRGPRIPIERLIAKQTRVSALAYGIADRGAVLPGLRADFNLIDAGRLALHRPRVQYDLPAGGRRFMQTATGYRHTFVAGVETLRDDRLTGATPGRLLRG